MDTRPIGEDSATSYALPFVSDGPPDHNWPADVRSVGGGGDEGGGGEAVDEQSPPSPPPPYYQ